MKKQIPILIISMKNSKRLNFLSYRMKKLKLNFKTIIGVNGQKYYNKKKIKLISCPSKILKNIGREMSPPEIGAAASHLKAYRYIIRNKLDQCIIMEDDAYPSILIKKWAYDYIKLKKGEILSFYSYPNGFVYRKIYKKIFNNINIHKNKTHLFNNSFYQISIATCKNFIKTTHNKVSYPADWHCNLKKNKIRLLITIPFIGLIDDKNTSHLRKSRNEILKKNFTIKFKDKIPNNLKKIFSHIYTLSFLRFLFRKGGNYSNFYEHFFKKSIYTIINLFSNKYYDMNKVYFDPHFYYDDLIKNCNSFFKNLKNNNH